MIRWLTEDERCPCADHDCPKCEAKADILRKRILDAVASGEVTEEEVFEAIFKVKKAELN